MHNSPNRGVNYHIFQNKGNYPVILIYAYKLGRMKQSAPQPNLGYASWNITLTQRTPHPPPHTPVANTKKNSISWL